MSATEWKIAKPGTCCAVCKSEFQPGTEYYSTLDDRPSSEGVAGAEKHALGDLLRNDYCLACFQTHRPADAFYFWKAAVPLAEDSESARKNLRPTMDLEHVFEFFKRLEGETAPQKIAFRYVLALILARKKILQSTGQLKDSDARRVQIYKEKGAAVEHAVIEPELSAEEIAGLSDELGAVLGLSHAAPVRQTAETAG